MLGSLSSVWETLSPAKLVDSVTHNYNKLKHKVTNPLTPIVVLPGLIHIPFPQPNHIQ